MKMYFLVILARWRQVIKRLHIFEELFKGKIRSNYKTQPENKWHKYYNYCRVLLFVLPIAGVSQEMPNEEMFLFF